jgi:hypothetical protein
MAVVQRCKAAQASTCVTEELGEMITMIGSSAGSEVASPVTRGRLRERDYLGLSDRFPGQGMSALPKGGGGAHGFSMLLAVYPLKQDVQHEVAPKNAKCQEDGN